MHYARVFEVNVFGLVRTVRPFVRAHDGARQRPHPVRLVDRGQARNAELLRPIAPASSRCTAWPRRCAPSSWGSGVTVGLVCPGATETELPGQRSCAAVRQQRHVRLRFHSAKSVADDHRQHGRLRNAGRSIIGVESKAPGAGQPPGTGTGGSLAGAKCCGIIGDVFQTRVYGDTLEQGGRFPNPAFRGQLPHGLELPGVVML